MTQTMSPERGRSDVGQLVRALRSHAFHFSNEAELQSGIETALRREGISFVREVPLTERDRIDFLCERLGVEVKLNVSPNEVIRQLHRYAQSDLLDALLLITSSMRLAGAIPAEMNGKNIFAYCLAGDAL